MHTRVFSSPTNAATSARRLATTISSRTSHRVTSCPFIGIQCGCFPQPPALYDDAKKKYVDWVASRPIEVTEDTTYFTGGQEVLSVHSESRKSDGIPSVLEIPLWHIEKMQGHTGENFAVAMPSKGRFREVLERVFTSDDSADARGVRARRPLACPIGVRGEVLFDGGRS